MPQLRSGEAPAGFRSRERTSRRRHFRHCGYLLHICHSPHIPDNRHILLNTHLRQPRYENYRGIARLDLAYGLVPGLGGSLWERPS